MRRKIISHRQDHHSGSRQDKNRWLFNPQSSALRPRKLAAVRLPCELCLNSGKRWRQSLNAFQLLHSLLQ
jgi:hypothetical protein